MPLFCKNRKYKALQELVYELDAVSQDTQKKLLELETALADSHALLEAKDSQLQKEREKILELETALADAHTLLETRQSQLQKEREERKHESSKLFSSIQDLWRERDHLECQVRQMPRDPRSIQRKTIHNLSPEELLFLYNKRYWHGKLTW